ncbi:MAG TPA: M48 family metalloprotease [Terriglobales bacterium]|nr:M48 family metalloprotease [Terriglobales bacterium]
MVFWSLLYGDAPQRILFQTAIFGTQSRCPRRLLLAVAGVLFGAILAPGTCPAQEATETVDPPREVASVATGQIPQDIRPGKKDKIRAKYDVDRIGDRGIGHGINMYSLSHERSIGEALSRAIERHSKLLNDPLVTDYVNRLGQKLVRNSDAEMPFIIKVLDSPGIGAFGLPGGYLYVDSGLLLATDSEAELAGVMAHEIAHVAARHATRETTRRYFWDLLFPVTLFAGPIGLGVQEAGGLGVPFSLKKFSRDAEREADLLGIEYEYAAGYDPEAFVVALEKLHAIEQRMHSLWTKAPGYRLMTKMPFHGQLAKAFANYPTTEDRLRRLQTEISILLPGKTGYVLDTSEFQEVKSRLASSEAPVLRRHSQDGTPGKAGPVLRRSRAETQDSPDFGTKPPLAPVLSWN